MKISLRVAVAALLLCWGTVRAQVPAVTINAGGGTATDNGLKITITENNVLTEYKGYKQYDESAADEKNKGLWTYFMLERRWGALPGETTEILYKTACEISDVEGDGTAANPWKVVKLLTMKNKTDATFNVSVVYTYEADKPWYRIDYFVSSNEQGVLGPNYGPYLVHIFHSESAWMQGASCGLGFGDQPVNDAPDAYQEVHAPGFPGTLFGRIGVRKDAGSCTAPAGVHIFRTADGATSYNARDAVARDTKDAGSIGYKLSNIIRSVAPEAPIGAAIHKAILLEQNTTPGWISHKQKSFIVGFDETDDGPANLQDAPMAYANEFSFMRAKVGFSSANPQGLEGSVTHVIDGVWLQVQNATFNLPQVVHIKVTTTGTGTGHAGASDYTVKYEKMIIPAGTYTNGMLPLNNILIHGDGTENEDKTLHLEIVPNCSPHIDLAGQITSADYTIVDDDENKIFLEPALTSLAEGSNVQVTVKMTGAARATATDVNIGFNLLTAKASDFAMEFPLTPMTVTIPAGANSAVFTFKALSDLVIENTETVEITASTVFGTEPKSHATTLSITDVTGLNAANRIITFSAPATQEGQSMAVTASLPAGVTTETAIVLNIAHNFSDPGNTADIFDIGGALPATVTIPAEGGEGSFTLSVATDVFLEPDEFIYFTAQDPLNEYTVAGPVQLILKNKISAGKKGEIIFSPEYQEGTDGITGTVKLPDEPSEPITVTIFVHSSSSADETDFAAPLSMNVTFNPASPMPKQATFKINLLNDNLLEGSEELVFAYTFGDLQAVQAIPLKVTDFENDEPANRQLILVEPLPEDVTEGQEIQVKVRLNSTGVTAAFPVDVTVSVPGTSTADAGDYTLDPAATTVTFAPGETEKIITVKTINDGIAESTEKLELNFTAAITTIDGIPETIASDLTKEINILDAGSTAITFTPEAVTLAEGGALVKVTAALSFGTAAAPVTISLDGLTGSGVVADDIEIPASVTINTGAATVDFYVKAKNDDILESDELFNISGAAAGYTITGTSLTVTDATTRQLILEVPAASMAEGGVLHAKVKLPAGITTSKAIDIQLTRGSATSADLKTAEYNFPATVTIPVNGDEIPFDITAQPDDILELTETLQLVATGDGLLTGLTDQRSVDITDVTGTIAGNTLVSVLPAAPQSVLENGNITYTFQLPPHITAGYPIVIDLEQQGGTTASPADFTGGIDGTVTIPAGGQQATLTLNAKSDGVIELQEKLIIQPKRAGFTFSPALIDLTVEDTDLSGATIQLSVAPGSVNEGSDATVTATLAGFTSNADIMVTLHRASGSSAGAADHSTLGTITIPATQSTGSITVTALTDLILENDELLEIGGTSGTFNITTAALTIKDQTGTAANTAISMDPLTATVTEGGDIKVKVKLPANITAADDIDITITGMPGTGLSAGEYAITPATAKIMAGANETEITIAATDDLLLEAAEQLTVNATATVYGFGPQTAAAVITINDADHRKITVTATDAEVTEDNTTVIRFSLPAGVTSTGDITVQLNGSGTAGAADFENLPASIVIPGITGFYELQLKAIKDKIIEPLETVTLAPSAPGYTISDVVSVNVKDADLADAAIKLVPAATDIAEGNPLVLTAQLQNGMTTTVPLDITLSQSGGTAKARDYSGLTGIRIDPADPASGTATIAILNDAFLEWTKTLTIQGSAAGITVTGTTVNLLDYNGSLADNKKFTLAPDAAAMEEGNVMTVWLRLPAGQKTEDALTITLQKATGTTLDDGEYTFPASVTIPAEGDAVSFTLKAEEDNLLEATEVLKLKAEASVYGTSISHEAPVDVTDKTGNRVITMAATPAEILEGAAGVIRFSLPAGITSPVDITIALTPGGSAGAADFTALPGSVTIEAGKEFGEITLNALKEGVIEPDETLVLTPAAGGFTFNGTAAVTVKDADLAAASIALTASSIIAHEGNDVTITATLQGGVTALAPIDVVLHKTGSTAADDDHSPLGTIHIDAGQSSATATVTVKADLLIEYDETLVLGGTAGAIAVTGTTVAIKDATERSITVTPATGAVDEGQKTKLTVSLPANVTAVADIAVAVAKNTGTTALGGEYLLPATVTIAAGAGSAEFDVEALADNILEADEQLNVIATASILGDSKTATAAVTIKDGTATYNNTLITISGDTEVTEGQEANITFSLPANISTAIPITITFTAGSATPAVTGSDLAGGIPVSVVMPADASTITLKVTALGDAVIEPVEKLFLLPAANGFRFSNNVMLDVLDEHHSGTITFSSDKPLINEGGGTATVTVSLPGTLVAGSDIRVDILKGTSTADDADHSALPSFVTIVAGQHDAVFTIAAPADKILEEEEALVLTGTAAGYSIAGATVRIGDATSLDPLNTVLQLTPVNADITEGATGDFVVGLPAGVTSVKPITVTLTKTAGVSTAADTDHTQLPVSVTIPAGQNASAGFDISAVPDLIIEPKEKLRIDGMAPAGFTFEGADIFISDATGQNPANLQISILPDSAVLHEGSTSKVIFSLPAGVTAATDITLTIAADGALTAGQADYSFTPATVVIPKENNRVTVVLEALQDNQQEATEQLKLTGSAAGYAVMPSSIITIPGDPAPQLTIHAATTANAAEPAAHGAFSLQLDTPAPFDVTVTYTMGGTAAAGSDYAALSGQTVIKAGESMVSIPVTVKDDEIVEGPEHVQLTLQQAQFSFLGSVVNCTVGTAAAAVQLADNDEAAIVIEKVADAAEPATAGSVKIRFANPQASATVPVTVQYTVSGTAISGADYTALPGTAVIPPGSNEVMVPVQAIDNAQLDGTRTVIIQLAGATAALPGINWPLGTPAAATVNVYDNDVVSMEIFGLNTVAEGATVPVTLKASQAVGADITVNIQLQHDAARTVTTNATRNGDVLTVVMPAHQTTVTFNITVAENEVNDDNGYVNLIIQPFTGTGQAYGKGASGNTAAVVTDNDPLEISFRKDTVRIAEGNGGQTMMAFTLQLSRMSSRAIQVQYEFADAFEGAGADKDPQRARAGEDFLPSPVSITIPPMQAEADITVAVNGDDRKEADEYFALKLKGITVAGGLNTPVPGPQRTAVGVIENDDQDVDMEIRPHKGVSPNGDGKNDVWIIENLEKYPRNEVVIVNRWGGAIFKTSNYHNTTNNFSGIANIGSGTGKELPDGSYFYILQVWGSDGKATRYNGYLVIKNGL